MSVHDWFVMTYLPGLPSALDSERITLHEPGELCLRMLAQPKASNTNESMDERLRTII
jgi:hypothetical protein